MSIKIKTLFSPQRRKERRGIIFNFLSPERRERKKQAALRAKQISFKLFHMKNYLTSTEGGLARIMFVALSATNIKHLLSAYFAPLR